MQDFSAYSIAFFTTCALIGLLSPVARHIGLIDASGGRKRHEGQIPLVGGIAMFCGFLFAVLALPEPLSNLRPLFAGAALLVISGVLDDFKELRPSSRFLAQVGAGLLMTLWGGRILENLGPLASSDDALLGIWALPLTVFSVVGVINAVNMLDGADGLAGGLSAFTLFVLGAAAMKAGFTVQANLLFIVGSTVIAFLLFNMRLPIRRRAIVFMGDAGSMFLGFVLAWFLVDLSQEPNLAISPVTALWILAIPLMDTVCIMFRRALKRKSPFLADQEHLHHLLQAIGFSVAQSVWAIIGTTAVIAAIGLWAEQQQVPDRYMFAAFLGIFVVYLFVVEIWWRRLSRKRIWIEGLPLDRRLRHDRTHGSVPQRVSKVECSHPDSVAEAPSHRNNRRSRPSARRASG